VCFDYSNHNGRYIIGTGQWEFETAWSGVNRGIIRAYDDPEGIRGVALAVGIKEFHQIKDAGTFDFSSRSRRAHTGDIVIYQNKNDFYAALKMFMFEQSSWGLTDEVAFSIRDRCRWQQRPYQSTVYIEKIPK